MSNSLESEDFIDVKKLGIKEKKFKIIKEEDRYEQFVEQRMDIIIEGVVKSTVKCTDSCIYFKVLKKPENETYLCFYSIPDFPLKKGDRVYIDGTFEKFFDSSDEERSGVKCYILTSRYIFDLHTLLVEICPNEDEIYISKRKQRKYENGEMDEEQRKAHEELLEEAFKVESKYSEKMSKMAEKIIDFSRENYGDGPKDLAKCLYSLSTKPNRRELEMFGKRIFGDDISPQQEKTVKYILAMYRNECLYRPFQLLGLTKTQILEIKRPLLEAYDIIFENPWRIPEIPEDTTIKIFNNYLRTEWEPKWEMCGKISRMIYSNYKLRKWTSTPISKLRTAFSCFDEYYEDLKDYFCDEKFEHMYYSYILDVENYVSREISFRLKTNNIPIEPIYRDESTDEQIDAVKGCLYHKVSILNGEAGTGKTRTLADVGRTLISKDIRPMFLSYTGAAVERIKKFLRSEGILDQCNVYTIHLAIVLSHDIDESSVKYIIFDEFSMVDLVLLYELMFSYRSRNVSYIFAGDLNQLEPMAAGNVMQQFLYTPMNIFTLTKNFRSQEGIVSLIKEVVDPERIEKRRDMEWYRDCDDYCFISGGYDAAKNFVEDYYKQIPKKYRKTIHDFDENEKSKAKILSHIDKKTIVTMFKKTVNSLNDHCQEIFMAKFDFVIIDKRKFHECDRVINTVNNYKIGVMNGEVGRVVEITQNYIAVEFRNDPVCRVPYFGKARLKSIKEIRKKLKLNYTPYNIVDGKTIMKDTAVINTEIDNMKGKFKPFNNVTLEDINLFFDAAKKYPMAIFGYTGECEFLSLGTIRLAYCITIRKAQGNEYYNGVFLMHGPVRFFENRRSTYTGLSRAAEVLTVIAENEESMNKSVNTGDFHTYENLSVNINDRLPEEMKENLKPIVRNEEYVDSYSYDDDPFDDDFF